VTGDDEIVIQGDVKDDLFDIIPEKWPEVCVLLLKPYAYFKRFNFQIDEDFIDDLGDQKR
jgi:density-regulated protein